MSEDISQSIAPVESPVSSPNGGETLSISGASPASYVAPQYAPAPEVAPQAAPDADTPSEPAGSPDGGETPSSSGVSPEPYAAPEHTPAPPVDAPVQEAAPQAAPDADTPSAPDAPAEPDAKAILRSVVTADEVVDRYDLKGKTVRRAVKKGALTVRKVGKVWLMRRDDARALWGKKGDPKAQQPAGPQHQVLDEVVLLEEAAGELGLKVKQLRKAAKAGKLTARKAGKHWLIRRADMPAAGSN